MKNLILVAVIFTIVGCGKAPKSFSISNTSSAVQLAVVSVSLEQWDLKDRGYVAKSENGEVIPVELIDEDGDGKIDLGLLQVEVAPSESLVMSLEPGDAKMKKQTQAELSVRQGGTWEGNKYKGGKFENVSQLRVPEEHTDHSFFIRYEGPGWESDQAAYRFYLDWRNGVDFFGKKVSEMVLQNVGQDGFDSYHEPSGWGMDLLKVGQTLGLGSIGRYQNDSLYRFQAVDSVTCEIIRDGALRSEIETTYFGWQTESDKTTLTSLISIEAGSALTSHSLSFEQPIGGFCTGLVVNKGEEFVDKSVGGYRLLATFGEFSLAGDKMGLAIIVPNESIEKVSDGAGSHVVNFKPMKELEYYFMAAWQQDASAVQTMNDFEVILDAELDALNNPLTVQIQ
ncbi:MAG: DUF4861 family protein [Cyclobacteriaceae bacterium]